MLHVLLDLPLQRLFAEATFGPLDANVDVLDVAPQVVESWVARPAQGRGRRPGLRQPALLRGLDLGFEFRAADRDADHGPSSVPRLSWTMSSRAASSSP